MSQSHNTTNHHDNDDDDTTTTTTTTTTTDHFHSIPLLSETAYFDATTIGLPNDFSLTDWSDLKG